MSAAAVIFMLIVTSRWLIALAKAWLRQGVAGCWTTIPGGRRRRCGHTLSDGQGSIALFSARTSKPSALMSISCPSPAHLALSSLPIFHNAYPGVDIIDLSKTSHLLPPLGWKQVLQYTKTHPSSGAF